MTRTVSHEVGGRARVSLSKTQRFQIFKRDGFQCQYCGATPPAVVLEVDHIIPVSKGGKNDSHNLVTACFDCNRGKRDGLLNAIPDSLEERTARAQELEDQTLAYEKLLRAKKRRILNGIKSVENAFQEAFPDYSFSASFKGSVRHFVNELPTEEVCDAMDLAVYRVGHSGHQNTLKYFCGICWKKIKSGGGQ